MFGITLTPDDLFRVARGAPVVLDNGQTYTQDPPLDWASVTDHAECFGVSDQIRNASPELLENPQGKRWYDRSQTSPQEGVKAAIPVALFFFNVGAEIGQLRFIAAVFAAPHTASWLRALPPYAIGTAAMFWVIQRISAF